MYVIIVRKANQFWLRIKLPISCLLWFVVLHHSVAQFTSKDRMLVVGIFPTVAYPSLNSVLLQVQWKADPQPFIYRVCVKTTQYKWASLLKTLVYQNSEPKREVFIWQVSLERDWKTRCVWLEYVQLQEVHKEKLMRKPTPSCPQPSSLRCSLK